MSYTVFSLNMLSARGESRAKSVSELSSNCFCSEFHSTGDALTGLLRLALGLRACSVFSNHVSYHLSSYCLLFFLAVFFELFCNLRWDHYILTDFEISIKNYLMTSDWVEFMETSESNRSLRIFSAFLMRAVLLAGLEK